MFFCHLSSKFTLVFIYTSDSNVSSQTSCMTYFPWFSPPFLKTRLEYSGFLSNDHANCGLWFSCKPVSLVFLPKPLTHLWWLWSCHLNLKWALDYWPERTRSFHTSYRLFTAFEKIPVGNLSREAIQLDHLLDLYVLFLGRCSGTRWP